MFSRVPNESQVGKSLDALFRGVRVLASHEEFVLPALALHPNRELWVMRISTWDIAMTKLCLKGFKFFKANLPDSLVRIPYKSKVF